MPRLILASASPRRELLLRQAGYAFSIDPANIDEESYPADLTPPQIAEYLATAKAKFIASRYPEDVTLAADTVVFLGSQLLGKPTDAAHARQMLQTLSGSVHRVVTGVAVVHPAGGFQSTVSVVSTVQMRLLNSEEVERYVAGRQWEGKAGGYGIQDRDPFVTKMEGSLTNIVGLPMEEVGRALGEAGVYPGGPRL